MRISDWSSDGALPIYHPPLPRKLVIAAHSFILRYFQDALAQFEEDMPEIGIELDLDTCSAGPLAEKMRKGTVDIGFFYALGTPTEPESDLVWNEPLALFVAKVTDLAQNRQNVVKGKR